MQTSPFERQPWVTEATPLQYTFFVPHDVPGLAAAMGGPDKLVAELDLLLTGIFNKSVNTSRLNYDAGNEPDLQAPYMYMYAPGEAWRTQRAVAQLMRTYYTPTRDGRSVFRHRFEFFPPVGRNQPEAPSIN